MLSKLQFEFILMRLMKLKMISVSIMDLFRILLTLFLVFGVKKEKENLLLDIESILNDYNAIALTN